MNSIVVYNRDWGNSHFPLMGSDIEFGDEKTIGAIYTLEIVLMKVKKSYSYKSLLPVVMKNIFGLS